MKPEVSILIPSLRPGQLKWCIEAIINAGDCEVAEIVVVSPFVPPKYATIDIVHVEELQKKGVVNAVTQAYNKAKGDFVISLSDEVRVYEGWLKLLDEVKKDWTLIGDFVVEPPNPFSYWGIKFSPFPLISKKRADFLGGLLDQRYRAFYSDPDLSLRNYVEGGKVVMRNDCRIYHPYIQDDIQNKNVNEYFSKDREAFIQKWEPTFGAFPGDP